MKREIKTLEQLKLQADYMRLGRVEQAITEALIENNKKVVLKNCLASEFVQSQLGNAGYKHYFSTLINSERTSFVVELQ